MDALGSTLAGKIEPVPSTRNDAFALFPLQPDEATTCDAMLTQAGSRLLISPNHHINSFQVRRGRDGARRGPGRGM